jgi:F-type H+-transporting ATPase subunit alpha
MKKIAGTIRIDLAQYRELASFAQFGSELDAETSERLAQGVRIKEILKQPQYTPYPVEDQVQVIYVAVKGYFDDVAVDEVVDFEHRILAFLHSTHPEIGEDIVKNKKLTEANEEKLKAAILEFKERYAATKSQDKSETVEG